ncbi:DUF4385 domain-containing protein [Rufibacter psychrotolerans]|uniref:DUF4385 domain-containing protein n=1 Tax=Rufibacter psychrotolerans TaxID=2812556 RepID=UPI001F074666|nr:DUF4385 domain-containing protein [Rufibacter sp. SYSU D00308]
MGKNSFNYSLDFKAVDFRQHPELYRIGVGEQGVLLVEPYKSELLPHWRFRNVAVATQSAQIIYSMFEEYLARQEFVGADMARKFLQMGFTRARRYANHKGGKKYAASPEANNAALPYPYSSGSPNKGNAILPQEQDALTNEKAQAAAVFKAYWFKAKAHPQYLAQKQAFKDKYYLP